MKTLMTALFALGLAAPATLVWAAAPGDWTSYGRDQGGTRFSPLAQGEFEGLRLEISVLSPPEEVQDLETIQVGEHGLIVTQGPYSGLLLPQVATEWGWDRETFLSQTCVKAGLPGDFWKTAVPKIEKFSAEVFSESSEGLDKALDSGAANE